MTKEQAQKIISRVMTDDIRNGFYNSIFNGFEKYNTIRTGKDYSSLGVYSKNGERRLLYSSVCSCLESDDIRNLGFNVEMEQFTSSYKTHIYNESVVIDVFDDKHDNNSKYQNERFELNADNNNQSYIIITYYGNKKNSTLDRIMIRILDSHRNTIYEEDLCHA